MATPQILLQLRVSATVTNKLELETQSRTLDLNLKHATPISLSYRPGDVERLHRHDISVFGIGLGRAGVKSPNDYGATAAHHSLKDRSNAEDKFYILWSVTISG